VKATRREALLAALAVPAAAAVPAVAHASGTVVVYGAGLGGHVPQGAVPITGDPIRFARELFARRPALVLGVSRSADALLIAEVGRENGFRELSPPASLGEHGWALAKG
jgi:hypothetical protein